jgi:hypothetical protein
MGKILRSANEFFCYLIIKQAINVSAKTLTAFSMLPVGSPLPPGIRVKRKCFFEVGGNAKIIH